MRTPMSRPFLLLCGLLYLGFGLAVLLAPEPAEVFAGIPPAGILNDFDGTHGGVNAALGLFLLHAAFSGPWHRPGLLLVALVNGGYLAGRLIELMIGDPLSAAVLAVMALEAALCGLALSLAYPGRTATA